MGENPDVTGRGSRPFLIMAAIVMLTAATWFFLSPPDLGSPKTPADARVLAMRIARNPTDWPAASALTEVALDTRLDTRVILWRTAYEHASLLAPERTDPPTAFARAAFFHWWELSKEDQRDALDAYAGLMRDPIVFARMEQPIFELTGDLSYLRRSGPQTANMFASLMNLALANGRFADYRALRADVQQKRLDELRARLHTDTPEELMSSFPPPPYHESDEPLIKALLDELHQRPLSSAPSRGDLYDELIDYAIRHELGPLDGLEVITRSQGVAAAGTQIRLAKALGLKERAYQLELASNDPRRVLANDHDWQGLCGTDICRRAWRTIDAGHGIALTLQTQETDAVPAYVEIYVDDHLRAERGLGPTQDIVVPVGNPGEHRIEVVLANPTTRKLTSRRIRVASVTTL
jgi:hypothetical protein